MDHRSFLFSNSNFDGAHPVGMGFISIDTLSIAVCDSSDENQERGHCFGLIIGYAVDIDRPDRESVDILIEFCELVFARKSWSSMLERLNGRFVIIWFDDGKWSVVTDATGMRTVYYQPGSQFFLSSHSHLIPGEIQPSFALRFHQYFKYGMPGNHTRREGVFLCVPNHVLDPQKNEFARYWPSRERSCSTLPDALEAFTQSILTTTTGLARQGPLLVSVTAGLDSRTTLAAFLDRKDVTAFSYFQNDSVSRVDVSTAAHLCRIVEWRYRKFRCSSVRNLVPPDYTHIASLPFDYQNQFGIDNYFHVRSNISEIGRRFWQKMIPKLIPKIGSFQAKDFVWNRGIKDVDSEEPAAIASAVMIRYFDLLGYDPLSKADFMGFDPLDMFYWEHRMPMWHGPLLLGSDPAFDTGVIFNSHRVLGILLSLSEEERSTAALLHAYIQHRNPNLLNVPINPRLSDVWKTIIEIRRRVRGVANIFGFKKAV